ncbi:MAG: DUF4129 domain-containing protein [Gaiellaceae bacterium]|jgi:uncharacterized membrane protein
MTRSVKAGAVALGVVGLLVIVAMAARGSHPRTGGDVATRPVPDTLQDSLVTLLVIAYAVAIVLILIALFHYKDRWHDPKSRWLKNFAVITLVMLIATAIGYYGITHSSLRHRAQQAQQQRARGGTQQRTRHRSTAVPAREAHFEWPLALGVAGLILLGSVWIYVRGRRRIDALTVDDDALGREMVSAIETTIDDLRGERDARRAVIAAYAQMEHVLARHGLGRDRAEAPLEYLARVLRDLDVRDDSVGDLTALFEYAKFSRHEIDATMKERAIDALVAVRDDLQREEQLAA